MMQEISLAMFPESRQKHLAEHLPYVAGVCALVNGRQGFKRTLLSMFANLPSAFFLRAPLFGLKCAQRCNASDLTTDDTGGRKRKMTWFCCE